MKSLYAVCNGRTGESYVRCYVWADSPERALALANEQHLQKYKKSLPEGAKAVHLLDAASEEFATKFTDHGWPDEYD